MYDQALDEHPRQWVCLVGHDYGVRLVDTIWFEDSSSLLPSKIWLAKVKFVKNRMFPSLSPGRAVDPCVVQRCMIPSTRLVLLTAYVRNKSPFEPLWSSAGNRLALGAGRRGRSEVVSPPPNVLGEGGEPSPDAWGRRGGARVWGSSSQFSVANAHGLWK